MRRLSVIFALAILLAVGAIGAMSAPSCAQMYGYNYPPPPQNIYATPWVGPNTPWTFYQGDWFLNGILQYFFGPQYGWAPYYTYPTVYIVRPYTWYEPRWNVWYQHNPHYWQTFTQKYPYWCGHRVGQHYDQNFYNTHHRGQGEGWNQGFHGVRPPEAPGHGVRGPGTPGPGVRPPGTTGPAVHSPGGTGPGGHPAGPTGPAVQKPGGTGPGGPPPGATAPGVRPRGTTGPGGTPAGATGPAVHKPGGTGPGGPPPGATGAAVQKPGATGPAVQKPAATGPGVRNPEKTTHGEEKKQ
jgi:hypothetical protein